MRYLPAILLIGATLLPLGCNSDLRCRRETALLRAEYLDLEDKYYALLAQGPDSTVIVDRGASGLNEYSSATIAESGIPTSTSFNNATIQSGQAVSTMATGVPEIVYYDQGVSTYPHSSGYVVNPGEVIVGSGVVSEGTVLSAPDVSQPVLQGQGEVFPAPMLNNSNEETILEDADLNRPNETEALPMPGNDGDTNNAADDDGVSILELDTSRLQLDFASQSTRDSADNTIEDSVASIRINRSVSHGEATDNVPGDDKLKILLQTVTASGDVIEQAGNVSVSVIDEAAPQGEQQIGYWQFIRSEAELFFARDEFGNRGMLLQLPWEDRIPKNSNLTVYIRFETVDGRVLDVTESVTIDPPTSQTSMTADDSNDDSLSGDWYKAQSRQRDARKRRSRATVVGEDSQIETHPIDRSTRSGSADGSTYRRPAWKPVR